MEEQIEKGISCPYCGENITVLIDGSVPQQECIEDCQVCCRPITFRVNVDKDYTAVQVFHENE